MRADCFAQARGYPIGLIETSWGGTRIETWSSPAALAKCSHARAAAEADAHLALTAPVAAPAAISALPHAHAVGDVPTAPSVLWNAMVYPLLRNVIKGSSTSCD